MCRSRNNHFLATLGLVSVNFQCLEQQMQFFAWALMGEEQEIGQIVTSLLSFQKLCDVLVGLFRYRAEDSALIQELEGLVARASQVAGKRDTVIHSAWYGDLESDILRVKIIAKRKTGLRHQYQHIDPEYLLSIARSIKQVWKDLVTFFERAEGEGVVNLESYRVKTPGA